MCHHFRRLCFWDSWAVTSWTVLFSYRGREAARNGITNSSVLTSASCVCLHACACDGCRGFCQPSGYFFDFQETMIMFILDTWSLSMLKNQVATWQLLIFFLLLLLPRLLRPAASHFLPFSPCHGYMKTVQFKSFSFLTCPIYFPLCLVSSQDIPSTLLALSRCQVNKLWPISQLPLANLYRLSITF